MIVSIDMSIFPKPLIHFRFQQIQKLAISKGFEWYYSGKKVLKKLELSTYPEWNFSFDFNNKKMMFEKELFSISYYDLLDKLKVMK